MGEEENASMVEFQTKRVEEYVAENLRKALDNNELKEKKAIFNAQSVLDLLEPTLTNEDKSAQILAYTTGPFSLPPTDEEKYIFNLVSMGLTLLLTEETPDRKTYSTGIGGLTIVWESNPSKNIPGEINHTIKLHRKADIK